MSWAAEEFAAVDLGDKRLNKRLVKMAQQWADKPTQSIPTAADGWGDTAAAYRMLDNDERLAQRAVDLPQMRLVQVGDRESDILGLMQRAQALGWPVDLLVRSQHNRVVGDKKYLWDEVSAEAVLGEIQFTLGGRDGRKPRLVRQQLRAKRMRLDHGKHADGAVEMTCLVASEVDAPAGVKPVCWRLLTNREVSTSAQIIELIEWYRARWEIEMLFNVLKNGCRVEALQLASLEKIERALTLFMVVSWRIARLMRLGRTCPELPAALMFDPDEIRAAHVLTNKPMPKEPPSLNDMVRRVAMLGGFLARKGDGEPGVKTIWIGLQRVTDFAAGVRFMRLSGHTLGCVS